MPAHQQLSRRCPIRMRGQAVYLAKTSTRWGEESATDPGSLRGEFLVVRKESSGEARCRIIIEASAMNEHRSRCQTNRVHRSEIGSVSDLKLNCLQAHLLTSPPVSSSDDSRVLWRVKAAMIQVCLLGATHSPKQMRRCCGLRASYVPRQTGALRFQRACKRVFATTMTDSTTLFIAVKHSSRKAVEGKSASRPLNGSGDWWSRRNSKHTRRGKK